MAEKSRDKKFWLMFGIVLAVFLVKDFLLSSIIYSIAYLIFGINLAGALAGVVLTAAVCGAIIIFFFYRMLRDDTHLRRETLKHFSEVEFTKSNINKYIWTHCGIKRNTALFAVAVAVNLALEYWLALLTESGFYYVFVFVVDFLLTVSIFVLFQYYGHVYLFKKWQSEKLH